MKVQDENKTGQNKDDDTEFSVEWFSFNKVFGCGIDPFYVRINNKDQTTD